MIYTYYIIKMMSETEILHVNDRVQFVRKNTSQKNNTYTGTICAIKYLLINRDVPSWGSQRQLFVTLDDTSQYEKILTRGSLIISNNSELYTLGDSFCGNNFAVIEYDETSIGCPHSYPMNESLSFIRGMLVYSGDFDITKRL